MTFQWNPNFLNLPIIKTKPCLPWIRFQLMAPSIFQTNFCFPRMLKKNQNSTVEAYRLWSHVSVNYGDKKLQFFLEQVTGFFEKLEVTSF